MNFKKKLFLGFSASICVLIIVAIVGLFIIQEQNKKLNALMYDYYEQVQKITNFQLEISNISRMIRDLILKSENIVTKEEEEELYRSWHNAAQEIESLRNVEIDEANVQLIGELEHYSNLYENLFLQVLQLVKENNKQAAASLLIDDYREVRNGLVITSEKLRVIKENAMNKAVEDSQQLYDKTLTAFISLITISFFLTLFISIFVVRSIISRINDVNEVISNAIHIDGSKFPRIKKIKDDEIGQIAIAYNQMATSLEKHMEKENNLKDTLKREAWVKSNWAELMLTYQGVQDLNAFSQNFISKLTPTIGASFGVLYLKNEEKNNLYKVASFAEYPTDDFHDTFHFGEGLVGQAALENKTILIEPLPAHYIKRIKSGIGDCPPKSLLIMPIEFENEVIAVVEFGSLHSFSELHQQFLELLFKTVGLTLNRIYGHMKIEKLLAESQLLTEELQSQTEELQQQQEELKMMNEQLEVQYKTSEEKSKELEKIKMALEEKNRDVELTSKYKSEFLANMSHELRTPLNSMLILSQLLAENTENNLTEKQVEYAKTIHTSGKDLLDLINDALDLSKIESGKMGITQEEILFSDIKEEIYDQFAMVAAQKNLAFEVLLDEKLPISFQTDGMRLKQIVKNLLSNAFKFTEKGKVTVSFSLLENETSINTSKQSFIVISVADTGIGIPKDKFDFIFEAFHQIDGTMSRKYGGTGLGLSIVKELVQLLGGHIEVQSEVHKGSTFTVYIPELTEHTVEQEMNPNANEEMLLLDEFTDPPKKEETKFESHEIKERLENKKILIVDDDMRNIFSLTTALEMNKMIVEFAENGKEAIHILESQADIDLILMDIMMPVMNGYEAIQEIRKMEQYSNVPIIALTAKAMKQDRQKCLEAGASDYISKPVNIEQLLSLIRVWLYR